MEPVEFGGGEDTSPAPEPQQEQSLKNVFLSEVDPNDRRILEKYVDKWDAGATKKFQEYSEKLKGYEALGPIEQLKQLQQFGQVFNNNPEQVFRAMYDQFAEQYGDSFEQELDRILEIQREEQRMSDEYQGQEDNEPDPDEVWRGNVESEVEQLREWREQQEQAAQQEADNRQLDTILKAMHNKVGDFDDDFVIGRLALHGDPSRALKEFNQVVQKFGGKQAAPRQAPMSLGGQGGVPSQQIDASKLRGDDRKKLVAQLLEGNG